jgi:acetylornithine deacetylase/succinyl-diaminopimelate desuccinylase-like protein
MPSLDDQVAELAARYRPLAAQILKEAIRIPADYVDRAPEEGGDPLCGLSNHEGPRLEYLRRAVVEIGAVRRPEDASFDEYGNLVWVVQDEADGVPPRDKRVIYMDGHTDTVQALRPQWRAKLNGAIDSYKGLIDPGRVDRAALRDVLGYLPPDSEWEHLLFGRGAADQLSGVVAQIVATKILLELAPAGALRGAIVRSYGTAAEEDNDGAGPMYLMGKVLPGAPPALIPDVVILTEGTGDSRKGALGIYRGQRGRMQIEVTVTGRSCHGSMPWEGDRRGGGPAL